MNLQIALIALGILLVGGIYLYSRWQERQRENPGEQRRQQGQRGRGELAEPRFGMGAPQNDDDPAMDFDADKSGERDPVQGRVAPPAGDDMEPAKSPDGGFDADDMGEQRESAGDQYPEGGGGDDIPVLEARVDTDVPPWEDPVETPSCDTAQPDRIVDSAGEYSGDNDPDVESGESPVHGEREDGVNEDEEVAERDIDAREERSSLGAFLGSFKSIDRIRTTLQHKLDAVRAERERDDTMAEDEMPDGPLAKVTAKRGRQTDLLDTMIPNEDGDDGEDIVERADPDADTTANDMQPTSASGGNGNDGLVPAPGFEKLSQIDYYVKLSGERDVSRDSVLAVYREAAADLTKSHSVYGLRLPDRVWRDLENESEEARFGDLVITMQLADRDGPVSEAELTSFSKLVVKLSESTGRGFSFMAPIENARQQAQSIDRFRRQFDSIFVVNIKPLETETFEGAMIDRCASQIGLTPDDNRFYARYKPIGKQKVCLYSLANMSETGEFDIGNMRGTTARGVTFFTRPAVNRSPGAVFSEMVDAAKAFASRVKGEAIAPGYDELSTENVEAIRRSIENVAREMESYGMTPGSEEASRLF